MSGMLYALAHTPTAEQRNLWGAECWPGRSMHRMQTTYPPAPCQWVQPARKCQWVSCLPIHVGITPLGWIPVLSLVDWWWCAISAISSIHILITFMSVSPLGYCLPWYHGWSHWIDFVPWDPKNTCWIYDGKKNLSIKNRLWILQWIFSSDKCSVAPLICLTQTCRCAQGHVGEGRAAAKCASKCRKQGGSTCGRVRSWS